MSVGAPKVCTTASARSALRRLVRTRSVSASVGKLTSISVPPVKSSPKLSSRVVSEITLSTISTAEATNATLRLPMKSI